MRRERGGVEVTVIVIVAVLAALGGLVFLADQNGARRERAKIEKQYNAERDQRREMISGLALELAARSEKLNQAEINREREVAAIRKDRDEKLMAYVPRDTACLRLGFVRYTNAAAAGVPLDARPGPEVAKAPSGVGTDEAAAVIARNYDKYHDCKATLAGALKDFDTKRQVVNSVVDRINKRLERAERKVQ